MSAPVSRPHYLLFTEAKSRPNSGEWRFVVQSLESAEQVEVADVEENLCGDRLDLLTVIRGLESLDQPSRVTLVTSSRFVKQGIDEGLAEWRENDWTWERFGERVPVKHFDLWRRLDHALAIHQVQCRRWRLDSAHTRPMSAEATGRAASQTAVAECDAALPVLSAAGAAAMIADEPLERHSESMPQGVRRPASRRPGALGRMLGRLERWTIEQARGLRLKASQFGTSLLPAPWLE